MADERFQVADGRNPPWHRADNRVIDDYGAKLGPYGLAVYYSYCRRANQNGQCWPSHATTARDTGMSVTSVKKAEERILELKLMKKEDRRYKPSGPRSNLITLLEVPTLRCQATEAQVPGDQGLRRDATTKNTKVEKTKGRTYSTTGASRSHESTDSQEENDSVSDREKVLRDFGLRGSIVLEIAKNRNMAWIRKAMKEMDKPEPGGVIFLHRQGWEPRDEDAASGIPIYCSKCADLEDICGCPDPKPRRVLLGELTPIQQRRWEGVPLEIS